MVALSSSQIAEREKHQAALSSVVAALALTSFKIIVGLLTNSLGILAEAAHSGFDLVAAVVTLISVRLSGRPADDDHPYGHGKFENLSALFETALLLLTCVWIIYESVHRLNLKSVEIDPSIWAFVVMLTSIVIDFSRSRMLYRAAKKHNSQALEADALHFSTDIWSSLVVLVGLGLVKTAEWYPNLAFLTKADAIAALGVALIVVYVSFRLGMRTVQGLVDQAPAGLADRIKEAVEAIPGIADCHQIRIRPSGPQFFVDLHISLDENESLKSAHSLTETVEQVVRGLAPRADVTVHPEPIPASKQPL